MTASQFDGYWETNNSYNGAFQIGGSDNTLWPDGMLFDSGTAFNSAGSAAGQFHLWCDYLEKTFIGPLYIIVKETGAAYMSVDLPITQAQAITVDLLQSRVYVVKVVTSEPEVTETISASTVGSLFFVILGYLTVWCHHRAQLAPLSTPASSW